MVDPRTTARLFCIGRQVVLPPAERRPGKTAVSVRLVKARPVSSGGRMTVQITGRDDPVPLEHLRIDDAKGLAS